MVALESRFFFLISLLLGLHRCHITNTKDLIDIPIAIVTFSNSSILALVVQSLSPDDLFINAKRLRPIKFKKGEEELHQARNQWV